MAGPGPEVMPTWQQFMVPVLEVLLDGETRRLRDIYGLVADHVGLTDSQRAEAISSGMLRHHDRIGWAVNDLTRAEALERPSRGHYRITDVGRTLLERYPRGITEKDLRTLPAYTESLAAAQAAKAAEDAPAASAQSQLSPEEQIGQAIDLINADVADALLARLHAQDPAFFEQAVLDLLMAMGYGGAEGKATRTRLSSDGGIDGIVDQDALGLSRIYVQAKRYALDSAVGRPEIQAFVGALHGNQANQGVFITSGRFSAGAREYAANLPTRVILIDGERLAALMIRYGVGVQVKRTVHIVEVDEDFFE
jgi:restriction system protein